MPWSDSARRVLGAIRSAASEDGVALLGPSLVAVARLLPGDSSTAQLLRRHEIWRHRADLSREYSRGNLHRAVTGIDPVYVESHAEDLASEDGSFEVGERHIVEALPPQQCAEIGIDYARLLAGIRLAELGPELDIANSARYWNGLLDSNIIVQYRDPAEIDWPAEAGTSPVMLWYHWRCSMS